MRSKEMKSTSVASKVMQHKASQPQRRIQKIYLGLAGLGLILTD